jgi:Ni/Fe-hydrogenase subunit HybB-like protein
LAVTIIALYLSSRSLNVRIDLNILSDVSQVIAPLLAIYGLFRGVDILSRGNSAYLWTWREETLSFWLEIALFVIAPVLLLSRPVVRSTPKYLYWTCCVIVMGFIANRLDVSITGLQASSGFYYVPKWTEFALSLATVTAAIVAFRYAVLYLDVLPKNSPPQRWMVRSGPAQA